MNKDLKIIKKKYGEEMMHFCRELFPTILEEEGKLSNLLLDHFNPSHNLYNDIIENKKTNDFKNYIYSLLENNRKVIKSNKTPEELLNEAGYDFYECHTEEEIQAFKKYYVEDEKLCTFNGGRLKSCHVFFAVKKNVNEIKREDFKNPERQDEYGTSVISIQFTRNNNTLSIKNRYNHTVSNPDATFSNNLDNIIPGLTDSFEKFYDIIQNDPASDFELPNYVRASDGKYYKYNYELGNSYYCPDNIIIDEFEVKQYEKEKYIVFDYFILDLQNKKIEVYDDYIKDDFINGLQNIKDISVEKNCNRKTIYVYPLAGEIIEIVLDRENRLISYKNNNIIKIGDAFLRYNKYLSNIECTNIKYIGSDFLKFNHDLIEIELPNVTHIGNSFLYSNTIISKINIPNIVQIENRFLYLNEEIKELSMPKVETIGNCFMNVNNKIKEFDCPNLTSVGYSFFIDNQVLEKVNFPKLENIDSAFLFNNNGLTEISLPNAKIIKTNFLYTNCILKKIELPKVEEIGDYFLYSNLELETINLPNVKSIGRSFLYKNYNKLIEFNAPLLEFLGNDSLCYNNSLQKINVNAACNCLPDVLKYNNNASILNYKNRNKKKYVARKKVCPKI